MHGIRFSIAVVAALGMTTAAQASLLDLLAGNSSEHPCCSSAASTQTVISRTGMVASPPVMKPDPLSVLPPGFRKPCTCPATPTPLAPTSAPQTQVIPAGAQAVESAEPRPVPVSLSGLLAAAKTLKDDRPAGDDSRAKPAPQVPSPISPVPLPKWNSQVQLPTWKLPDLGSPFSRFGRDGQERDMQDDGGDTIVCDSDPRKVAELIYKSQTATSARQRRQALRALGKHNGICHSEILVAMVYALHDPDEQVRAEAAAALGHQVRTTPLCCSPEVVTALTGALNDPDREVALSAATALRHSPSGGLLRREQERAAIAETPPALRGPEIVHATEAVDAGPASSEEPPAYFPSRLRHLQENAPRRGRLADLFRRNN